MTARARNPFAEPLEHLTRQRGVLGGLVVSESDGIVVDAVVQPAVRGPVVAALAASLYRRARQSARAAGLGGVRYLELVAEHGRLCMAGAHGRVGGGDDLVVVLVTDARAGVGLLRVELLRVVAGLTA
jgi:predicted regulator of Ras-like GTPase activity (Roadblock/LC7/MglB family)